MENNNLNEIIKLSIIAIVSDDYLMDRLVLKGGNAINFIYKLSRRSSIDIDYSMQDEFSENEFGKIKERLENTLTSTYKEHGYTIFDFTFEEVPKKILEEVKKYWGGYKINFKIIQSKLFKEYSGNLDILRRRSIVVGPAQRRKYKIDISKFEYCDKKKRETLQDYNLYVYTPEMLVFEKLRAICQQSEEYKEIIKTMTSTPRARDFYDIYILTETFSIDIEERENIELLKNIFSAKKVPLEFIRKIKESREFHKLDYPSLKDTVEAATELKEFDFYFDYVVDKFSSIDFKSP